MFECPFVSLLGLGATEQDQANPVVCRGLSQQGTQAFERSVVQLFCIIDNDNQ